MMSFKDKNGLTWDITLNVGTAKAVKDATEVNLFAIYSTEAMKVFSDPCLLVNVLYVLCRKQSNERNISDVQFGEALVGDAIEDAVDALMKEVSNFFPSSRRKVMEKMYQKSQAAAVEMEAQAMKQVEELDVMSLLKSTKLPVS